MKTVRSTENGNHFRFKIKHIVLPAVILILFSSACRKESNNGSNSNTYLVSYNRQTFLLSSTIKFLLGSLDTEYPEADSLINRTNYNVDVYKIEYNTQYKDSMIIASGLVCIPSSVGNFPVISFQNGTNTAHANAPSVNPSDNNYLLLEAMAGNGYIILIPDYIGFGASGGILHPYYNRSETNRTVTDMFNAVYELLNTSGINAKDNGNHYLMGYSQGGWATLSVLDAIENNGDTGYPVKAASCGAGAYNLISMSDYVLAQDTFPGPLYLPYFIYGQMVIGNLDDPLNKYFKEPYATRIPGLFDGSLTNDEVDAQLNDTIQKLVTDNLINNFASGSDFATLRDLLTENSVDAWNTSVNINFYYGSADINVPPFQSTDMYNAFLNAGVSTEKVKLFELPGLTHDTGIIPWGIKTIIWFNSLEGK